MSDLKLTQDELIDSAKELQKNVESLMNETPGKFNPVLTVLNRKLKEGLLQISQLGDMNGTPTTEKKSGIGEIRKYEKSSPKVVETPERKNLKIGEVANKPTVVSNEKVNEENQKFIDEIAQLNKAQFKKRYDKPNTLKAIGKVINEMEGEEKIDLKAEVPALQDSIFDFIHEGK